MNNTASIVIEIAGKRFELTRDMWENLDCIPVDAKTFHLIEDGKTHTISVIGFDMSARTCTLKVDGELKHIRFIREVDLLIEKMGLANNASKKLSSLSAPMPGMVTGIKVTPGQEVEKGTSLIILEAMKMENMMTAPEKAVIKSIQVQVGQAVEKGTVLIEFD